MCVCFQGTSAEQDNRFSNKQKKLLKQLKFAECLDKKVHRLLLSPIYTLDFDSCVLLKQDQKYLDSVAVPFCRRETRYDALCVCRSVKSDTLFCETRHFFNIVTRIFYSILFSLLVLCSG